MNLRYVFLETIIPRKAVSHKHQRKSKGMIFTGIYSNFLHSVLYKNGEWKKLKDEVKIKDWSRITGGLGCQASFRISLRKSRFLNVL